MADAGHMLVRQDENNHLGLVMDANGPMFRFMKSCMVLDGGMNSSGEFILHVLT